MDKTLRNTIIAGIFLIGVSVAYYFVFRPISNERKLNVCLQEANTYLDKIKENSEDPGKSVADIIIDKTNNPTKSAALAELKKRAEEAQRECFAKYPQK
jgi:hypothetical protein